MALRMSGRASKVPDMRVTEEMLPPSNKVDESMTAGSSPKRKKILIVDDDGFSRDLIRYSIENEGHELIEVESGQEALNIFQVMSDIDLVITDLAMPGMDGDELVMRLRENRVHIPIIVVSGGIMDPIAHSNFLHCRVFALLQKPVDQLELLQTTRDALRAHELSGTLNKKSPRMSPNPIRT
jgi:CheY-like chemotaxis protein